MKKWLSFLVCITVLTLSLCSMPGSTTMPDRYFDDPDPDEPLTITILYPSAGSIRSMMGLREQGFLPAENTLIVGAYHADELTDYERSKTFVAKEGLDWFRFHRIDGELNKTVIFGENGCTPDFKKIFEASDGIIFLGGADIPPDIYGEKTDLSTGIYTPFRHYMELSFIFHLLGGEQDPDREGFLAKAPDFPLLAICLGEQTLNVGTGGTLVQDVWSEVYGKRCFEDVIAMGRESWHSNPVARLHPEEKDLMRYNLHRIRLLPEGKFCGEMGFGTGDFPYIISSHHQSVDRLGKQLRIIARSYDGKTIDAIEHTLYPNVLGTQFHPEFYTLWDKDRQFRIALEDTPKSIPEMLAENPPSYAFHKAIWAWFTEKVEAYAGRSE
jgi:putative glutamine amidotransferase